MTILLDPEIALDGGNVNAAILRVGCRPVCTSAATSSTGGARQKLSLSTRQNWDRRFDRHLYARIPFITAILPEAAITAVKLA